MFKKIFLSIFFLIFVLFVFSKTYAKPCDYIFEHKNGLYVLSFDINSFIIEPYVSENLETVDSIAKKTGAFAAINTGFFDPKNKQTISFVTENGKILANPYDNNNLTCNVELKPHLDKIFNRGELRLYNCNGQFKTDINYRNSEKMSDCLLSMTTQAGPILLPELDLEKEFFILKQDGKIVRQSANVLGKTARSGMGYKGKEIYFFVTDNDNPMTIYEFQNKVKELNLLKALAFDGGGSVSLFVNDNENNPFYISAEVKGESRRIKSALLLMKKAK